MFNIYIVIVLLYWNKVFEKNFFLPERNKKKRPEERKRRREKYKLDRQNGELPKVL